MWGKLHKNMAAVKIFSNSPFTTGEDSVILYEHSKNAPVVQWIERQIPVLNVGGSSPSGRTTNRLSALAESLFVFNIASIDKGGTSTGAAQG